MHPALCVNQIKTKRRKNGVNDVGISGKKFLRILNVEPVMAGPSPLQGTAANLPLAPNRASHSLKNLDGPDIGKRFEQMLWSEMLSHAGLEKAFSQGGGETASAFSRFVVEAVAKDIAETHPLGFAEAVDEKAAGAAVEAKAPQTDGPDV
ncbi:MAG: hypothetical protein KDA43_14700 [Hyphomonas sp.]|nr:hypothetical protein [Hyphomonas sp.]